MTSEGTHHPGQQPEEASPGAGGPTPYGDRPARQDSGYAAGQPDLGWAPPPPAHPTPAGPAWATDAPPPAPAWGTAQPPAPNPAPTSAQWAPDAGVPQQPEPGRGGPPEPAWAQQPPPAAEPAWAQQPPPVVRATAQVPPPAPSQPTPEAPPSGRPEPTPEWNAGASQPGPAQSGGWAPEAAAWAPGSPAVATSNEGGWPAGDPSAHAGLATPGERPAQPWVPALRGAGDGLNMPSVEPWAPEEAWGNAERSAAAGQESAGAGAPPAYQPTPGPGISPANAVPLPPQEQRVPGASLAASAPADFAAPPPPAAVPPPADFAAPPPGAPEAARPDLGYEAAQHGWPPATGPGEPPAPPVVPAPRTSPELAEQPAPPPAVSGGVSASAAVPLASRVTPPVDQAQVPPTPAPQPRVYGRPAPSEPAEPEGYQADPQRFDLAGPPVHGHDAGFGADRGFGPDYGPGPESGLRPDGGFGAESDFGRGSEDRPADPPGYAPVVPAPAAPFPPSIPAFADAPASERPVNGTKPHPDEERPNDRFGEPVTGTANVNGTTAFPPQPESAFPPPAQPSAPAWDQAPPPRAAWGQAAPPTEAWDQAQPPTPAWEQAQPPAQPSTQAWEQAPSPAQPWGQNGPANPDPDQNRFDAFQPIAEPAADTPVPKVRNGRVLAAVLIAAVLILTIPLGLLMLLGKIGGNDSAQSFDPAVGSCVKQSGETAVAVDCGDAEAHTVVSKVNTNEECTDPTQAHVKLTGSGDNRVLCLEKAN